MRHVNGLAVPRQISNAMLMKYSTTTTSVWKCAVPFANEVDGYQVYRRCSSLQCDGVSTLMKQHVGFLASANSSFPIVVWEVLRIR